MKRKIIGFFVCMLVITTGSITSMAISQDAVEETSFEESAVCCTGSIDIGISPNTVYYKIVKICNCGEEGSLLNWEVKSAPLWITWTFYPGSGTNLVAPECVEMTIKLISPAEPGNYTGNIKVVNSDNPDDYCEIPVDITVFRQRNLARFTLFFEFLQSHPNLFPILRQFLGL